MKRLIDLHRVVLFDQLRSIGIDARKDELTLVSRWEREGDSLLHTFLPSQLAVFDRALGDSELPVTFFPRWKRGKGVMPLFLGGVTSRIFSPDGQLLEDPDWDAIRALRQILGLCGKLFELPSDLMVEASLAQYVETDKAISKASWFGSPLAGDLARQGLRLWFDVTKLDYDSLVMRHGPGAVAEKLSSNGKYANRTWTERLERVMPSSDHLIPSYRYYRELEEEGLLPPGAEPPLRVVCVPKTTKAARVIGIEPTFMMYAQQGISELLVPRLCRHSITDIRDQTPNQEFARLGSIDSSLATIDLSEASDRVSVPLVKRVFGYDPVFLDHILAARSTKALLPSGEIILLRKFASMGSALTFPIETMVFMTIIALGVSRALGVATVSLKQLERYQCRAYGDDLIVPSFAATEVVSLLSFFGLVVNQSKSFLEGSFRESCGKEYFRGHDVSFVKLRRRIPTTRQHVEELISFVAFRNLYREKYGPLDGVSAIDETISAIIPFPVGNSTTPGLVRVNREVGEDLYDLHPRLHRPRVKAMVPTYKVRPDPLEGSSALLKVLTTPFNEDPDHLNCAGRPVSASLKYRWVLV